MNWILTPVRNGCALTQRAVKSFLTQTVDTVRVLLIDNATTDGTAEWARSMHPKVVALRHSPPLSVAQSWNRGLRVLFASGAEHVLVVNNDVELRPDTYELLLANGGGFVTAVGVNNPGQMYEVNHPERESPHPDFSCYLIHRAVWERVGEFDENFEEAFCEDWDYHVRLHRAGVTAVSIGVPFYHVGSATIKGLSPEEQEKLGRQAEANREYFKQKYGVAGGSPEYYALFAPDPAASVS